MRSQWARRVERRRYMRGLAMGWKRLAGKFFKEIEELTEINEILQDVNVDLQQALGERDKRIAALEAKQ